jgi:hypothetical protein
LELGRHAVYPQETLKNLAAAPIRKLSYVPRVVRSLYVPSSKHTRSHITKNELDIRCRDNAKEFVALKEAGDAWVFGRALKYGLPERVSRQGDEVLHGREA